MAGQRPDDVPHGACYFRELSGGTAKVLSGAGNELIQSANLLMGKTVDNAAFVDDESAENDAKKGRESPAGGGEHKSERPIFAKPRSRL